MPQHKLQHFLARSYLRGFSAGTICGQHQVWILDKQTGVIRLGAVDKTAARSYYYSLVLPDGSYDHSIEEHFGRIESDFVDLVSRVKANIEAVFARQEGLGLTLADRATPSRYIFAHYLRVPRNMDWIRESSQKHLDRMKAMGLLQYGEKLLQNHVIKAYSHLEGTTADKAVSVLFGKNVAIEFGVRRRTCFFTCDNPVFRYNPRGPDGIIHPDTRLYFPLYCRACARLEGCGNELRLEKHHDPSRVDGVNDAIITSATKEIYANDRDRLRAAAERAGIEVTVREPTDVTLTPRQRARPHHRRGWQSIESQMCACPTRPSERLGEATVAANPTRVQSLPRRSAPGGPRDLLHMRRSAHRYQGRAMIAGTEAE